MTKLSGIDHSPALITFKAVTTVGTEEGTFEAVISTATVDRERDTVDPEGFVRSLQKWVPLGKKLPLAWNHSREAHEIVGHLDPETARVVGDEVHAKGWVDREPEVGQHVWRLVKSGTLGFSFGYLILKATKNKGGGRHITDLDVFEVTATSTPINGDTRVLSYKSAAKVRADAEKVAREVEQAPIEGIGDAEPSVLQKTMHRLDHATVDARAVAESVDGLGDEGGTIYARLISADEAKGVAEGEIKAVWSTAYVNSLPDSAFLYVESGSKDSEGKTTPRAKRHFPYKNAEGSVDLPHLRNALARIPQSNLSDDVKSKATAKARRILDNSGKSVDGEAQGTKSRAADPLRTQALGVAMDILTDGISVPPPARQPAQEAPDAEALRQHSRELMISVLAGES